MFIYNDVSELLRYLYTVGLVNLPADPSIYKSPQAKVAAQICVNII